MEPVQLFAGLVQQYLDKRTEKRRLQRQLGKFFRDEELQKLVSNLELSWNRVTAHYKKENCVEYFFTERSKRAAKRNVERQLSGQAKRYSSFYMTPDEIEASPVMKRGAEVRRFFVLQKAVKKAQKQQYECAATLRVLSQRGLGIRVTFGGSHSTKVSQDAPNIWWGECKMSAKQFFQEADFQRIVLKAI